MQSLFENIDRFFLLQIPFLLVLIMALTYFYIVQRHRDHLKVSRMQMDIMREQLEREIYNLNERLVASESRWKDVNHLLLAPLRGEYDRDFRKESEVVDFNRHRFFSSFGINHDNVIKEDDLVFVLMPFHPQFEAIFTEVRNACADINLRCSRGDEQAFRGDILGHILRYIVEARLIICLVDGRNANVFYELGISHALDKTTILISREEHSAPVDVKSNKFIYFSSLDELRKKLKDELARALAGERTDRGRNVRKDRR